MAVGTGENINDRTTMLTNVVTLVVAVRPCYFIMPEQHVVSCLNNVVESTSCFKLFQHASTTCSNEKLVEQDIVLALPSTINQ